MNVIVTLNNSNIEWVTSNIIKNMYQLAMDPNNTVSYSGYLKSPSGYVSQLLYLNNTFGPELRIEATKEYLEFEDPEVQRILTQYWGDGIGITATQVALVLNFNGKFTNNPSITSFDELPLFVNITEINESNSFNNCSNLVSIDLSNITKISGSDGYLRWNFESCTNLENIGNTENLTYLGYWAFKDCSKLKSINTTNVTSYLSWCLFNCSGLVDQIVFNAGITEILGLAFYGVPVSVFPDTIDLPNLQNLNEQAFFMNGGHTGVKHIKSLGRITTIGSLWGEGTFHCCEGLLDAVLPETLTTIKRSVFTRCPNINWVKVLSNTVPVYDASDPWQLNTFGAAFGESYRNNGDVTAEYDGKTYPIYVKDELLSQYQTADAWKYVGPGRLRPLSQFATDFPNG